MTQEIEVAREGAVMSAAFARPQKKNAITGAMYEALIEAFDTAEHDPEVGALAMSGKGGVFPARAPRSPHSASSAGVVIWSSSDLKLAQRLYPPDR
jgi:hypothetical protein